MVEIKTLVEFFDNCQVENVIAGLKFRPEKIVFVGFKKAMTNTRIQAVRDFFERRKINAEISFEIVGRYDFDLIVDKLNFIVDHNEGCYFDLTGGREIVLTAVGLVAAKRDIPLFQFDVESEKFTRILNCEELLDNRHVVMTIPEAVELNGCSVIKGKSDDFEWIFDKEFRKDIETLFDISKEDSALWNKQCTYLNTLDALGELDSSLTLRTSLEIFGSKSIDTIMDKKIISALIASGIITDYSLSGTDLTFRYKNYQVRECLTKAGNILELYGYHLLLEINEETPGFYDDMDIGIYIDWDKTLHQEYDEVKDTTNEVDLMVMRDLIPVFISCKNGDVHKEALYELDTVAQKFGGKYAKKVLFATYISRSKSAHKYIMQRAKDMNIRVIADIHKKTKIKLKQEIRDFVK